jgi:hypothetical protein
MEVVEVPHCKVIDFGGGSCCTRTQLVWDAGTILHVH